MRKNEVDLLEAMDMLDVPEEVLGKMVEEGELKARRDRGRLYFDREDIDVLIDRQTDEARLGGESDVGTRES